MGPGGATDDHDALTREGSGHRAIRGGMLRVAGYVAGLVLTAGAWIVVLRYLGRDDFGRLFLVVSVVAVIAGLSDAGLTLVGQRGYVVRPDPGVRRRFLADLMGLRTALTLGAAGLATAVAALTTLSGAQVVGIAVAAGGLIFVNAAATVTIPLNAQLRLGAITAVELVRQATLVAGLVVLALAAAGLVAFFLAYLVSGVATLVAAIALSRRDALVAPAFDRARWAALLREAAPVALSLVVNVIYLRVLAVLMAALSTEGEVGLFGASFRVIEIFVSVPQLMAGAAFPILAHAATADPGRFAYVLRRLAEASLLLAGAVALGLAIAAPTVMEVFGGEYASAAGVLSLQAFALLGAFLTQVWILGLVALDRRRDLAGVSAVGLVVVVALGCALIPPYAARGGAAAAVGGELALALAALVLLGRVRPEARPRATRVLALGAAGGLGALCALLALPDLLRGILAVLVYGGAALALRAVPLELLAALRGAPRAAPGARG